ncbi:MAG: T9SS type A sorting domain-containing protein [Chitinophagaceae bacterium]
MKKVISKFQMFFLILSFPFIVKRAIGQNVDSSSLLYLKTMTFVQVTPSEINTSKTLILTPYSGVNGGEVQIFPSSNPQSEINLSISKINPQFLVLSSNTLPPGVINYQGAFWSTDGGTTWSGSETLPNNTDGRGDPSTSIDANGDAFIGSMNINPNFPNGPGNGYSVQASINDGANWGFRISGTVPIIFDKEMITSDDVPSSPFVNYLYCAWMGLSNYVQYNRSTDKGNTFSNITSLTNYWGQGTNVQTDPSGEVYICWADYNGNNIANDWTSNGLDFCGSTDGGVTFSTPQRVISYTGIRQYNSSTNNDQNPNFNDTRVNDFPSMSVDKSNGPHRGRIYVALPVRQNGNGKAIIQVSYSDNKGGNWSSPQTISISNATQSWFPWISVDCANGIVNVVYYSFDQPSGFSTNTYLATSFDGGLTFSNQKVSSVSHITSAIQNFGGGYAGDYIGLASYNWKAYPAWMDNRTGQWQDYVRKIDYSPKIVGDSIFCSTSNFSIINLPSWDINNVNWTVSPNGVINLTSNGAQATATKISEGTATITISGNGIPTSSINISTIPVVTSVTSSMSGPCTNGIQTWYVTATPNMAGATNWHWTVDNPSSGIFIYSPNSQNTYMDVSAGGGVSVTYQDQCGDISSRNGTTIYSPCGSLFTVSPNPASNSINISASINTRSGTIENSNSTFSTVNIYDFQNNLVKHVILNNVSNTSINISNLPFGIYIVEIVEGNYKERHKIQILR